MTAEFPMVQLGERLFSRDAVLATPSPVPASAGIYAWYFRRIPPQIHTSGCLRLNGLTLLYIGISPNVAPKNGRRPSRSTLRHRLRTHYAGNAEGSTLRKTLGCLMGDDLGIVLRRVGSGDRFTFTNPGEQKLDLWMDANALVIWRETNSPWEKERAILGSGLSLPLNIQDNPNRLQTGIVQSARLKAMRVARELPIIADSGGARTIQRGLVLGFGGTASA